MRFARFLAVALSMSTAAAAQSPVFDVHVHLHEGAQSLDAYRAAADHLGVAGYGAMWFGGPNQALAGKPEATRAGNDSILALAAADPKLLPIATVHPYDGDAALLELQRVAGRGVKLLKIHPHTQRFDAADARVLTLVRLAGELGVVVLFDNANILPGDSEKLFNLALAAPKTKFVFAHIGGLNFRFWNILAAARTAENLFGNNIYFDISATIAIIAGSPIEAEFVWTLRNVGIDHLLFGSDYPQYSVAKNLEALERLPLTAAEKFAIQWGNAAKLFALKRTP
jgi:hypothetical protein